MVYIKTRQDRFGSIFFFTPIKMTRTIVQMRLRAYSPCSDAQVYLCAG